MGYKKYYRIMGVIVTAALLAATAACKEKPQTIDTSDIEELIETPAVENTTSENTASDDTTADNTETDNKSAEEDKYPGLVVVHTNQTSYTSYGMAGQTAPPEADGDLKAADIVITADGREYHYEHIDIQYAPIEEDYKYDPYDVSNVILEVMKDSGYEEPYNDVMVMDSDEQQTIDWKSLTRASGVLNPQEADKTSFEATILEYETVEEADKKFLDYADSYNSYDKIDVSLNSEENTRTLSNFFLKQSGSAMQAFICQKKNVVFFIYTGFAAAPRFNSDDEEIKPVYDLDTVEAVMTELNLPFKIFYED
ncbi:hypothetical protein SAMN04487760_11171 [Lachnospiraceae bacterium G41]|nr:hypothetical protein SAMN04487760_11171 [Lachnospiraceae bacterium G41]